MCFRGVVPPLLNPMFILGISHDFMFFHDFFYIFKKYSFTQPPLFCYQNATLIMFQPYFEYSHEYLMCFLGLKLGNGLITMTHNRQKKNKVLQSGWSMFYHFLILHRNTIQILENKNCYRGFLLFLFYDRGLMFFFFFFGGGVFSGTLHWSFHTKYFPKISKLVLDLNWWSAAP